MFTGIVDHCATIIETRPQAGSLDLTIQSQFTDFTIGESIAIDGACMTVTHYDGQNFNCSLSPETLQRTIAQDYQNGQIINVEKAMRQNDRVGGHFVTGHVDQTATVESCQNQEGFTHITISGLANEFLPFLLSKGSITVNGVSLTINQIHDNGFSAMLIPHTLEHTNLSQLTTESRVNIEFDIFTKCVARQLEFLHEGVNK